MISFIAIYKCNKEIDYYKISIPNHVAFVFYLKTAITYARGSGTSTEPILIN